MNVYESALALARLGWRVFPLHTPATGNGCSCSDPACRNQGKHPRVRRGCHDATTQAAWIGRWWRQWPDANIGVATGPASGIWVLDLDLDAAAAWWHEQRRQHPETPNTAVQRTGNGHHLVWQWPATGNIRNSTGRLAERVDVRGRGASFTAAPSLHRSGRRYAWLEGRDPWRCPPKPTPAWLLELVVPPAPEPQPAPTILPATDPAQRYAIAALMAAQRDVATAPAHQRNDTLNRAAYGIGRLVGASLLDWADAERVLTGAGVDVGQTPREAGATVLSGLRAGSANPRYPELRRAG